jgi:hypothetical protein
MGGNEMEKNVSRRNFVALAGAGIAVAGCSKQDAATGGGDGGGHVASNAVQIKTDIDDVLGQYSTRGMDQNHGALPIGKPLGPDGKPVPFKPAGICVVYIRFEKPKKPNGEVGNPEAGFLTVRHAYWPIDPKWSSEDAGAEELAKVGALIAEARRLKKDQWTQQTGSPKNQRREFDFENFGFKAQHRVYFFVDNSDIAFDKRTLFVEANGDTKIKANLIRFTKYLSRDRRAAQTNPAYLRYEPADPNYAFWNARTKSIDGGTDNLLVVDNYQTKLDDNNAGKLVPIEADKELKLYSMNIHLLAKSLDQAGNVLHIPLILDPDTGNGSGNDP